MIYYIVHYTVFPTHGTNEVLSLHLTHLTDKQTDRSEDIGLALLLQLVLPQLVSLQLVFDDVHTQSTDLIVCDQPVELREAENRAILSTMKDQVHFLMVLFHQHMDLRCAQMLFLYK